MTTTATSVRSDVSAETTNRPRQMGWRSCVSRSARCSCGSFSKIWGRAFTHQRAMRVSSTITSRRVIRPPLEDSDGFGCESRRDGGSHAGDDRDLSRNLARHRFVYSAAALVLLSFSQPLDSEWGTAWIWELLVPVLASLGSQSGAPAGGGAWTPC